MSEPTRSTRNGKLPKHALGLRGPGAADVPGFVWTTDTEFRLTSLAGSALNRLGLCCDSYIGHPALLLFPHSDCNSKACDPHRMALEGTIASFDFEIAGREFQASIEAWRDANGNIIGLVGNAIDNTERRVANRALRISEQNYRSLIEELPHAVCRFTPGGNLLQVNRTMLEMLGHNECDLLVCNLKTEVFAESEKYTEFIAQLRSKASCYGFETQWIRRDRRRISVSLGGRAVTDSSGEVSYLDVIAEDISERKQLEEQLRQAQKMQAVGQLAGGIAHDFNNLLTVIRGQVEMITEEAPVGHPLVSRLDEIAQSADRATTLVSQLLAFSRKQVLQTKVLDLNTVITNMSEMLGRLIGDNIDLDFMPSLDLGLVKVDPGQIEQVLMNLAVNARDAMPEGGRLTIQTGNVREQENAEAIKPGDYVQLSVRDTGCGIDEKTKARIFEPFFTTKEVGKGTGLGLAVVYGVVKQSGGHIRVESKPGAGTLFRIYLPRAQGAAEPAMEGPRGRAASGSETVLLVEDHQSIREMITAFLTNRGYRVLTATDGLEALELAKSHHDIALLLSDVMMPKMGGKELAKKLTEILPQLKVVLMSGHPDDTKAPDTGVRFLPKPFSMLSLAGVIREVLDTEQGGEWIEGSRATASDRMPAQSC